MGSGAHAHDAVGCLDAVRVVLDDLLAARTPKRIATSTCPAEAQPLVEAVNRLVGFMEELAVFVLPLAHGELAAPLPSPDNAMAVPFVELHARLSRLTWQAGEIARGDYSQRVDFMGDFSRAFNAMVQQLAEREQRLTAEIERRQDVEATLQRERDLLVAGPLVTFRWDIDDQGTVQYVSPNVSVFGYSADEFVGGGRTYDSVIHPDDRDLGDRRRQREGAQRPRHVDPGVPARRRGRRDSLDPRLHPRRAERGGCGDGLRGLHHRRHRAEARRDGAASPRGAAAHALPHRRAHRPLQPAWPLRPRRAHDAQRAPPQGGPGRHPPRPRRPRGHQRAPRPRPR